MYILNSPLEQFNFFEVKLFNFDFYLSLPHIFILIFINLFIFFKIFYTSGFLISKYLFPITNLEILHQSLIKIVSNFIIKNVTCLNQRYFPLLLVIFINLFMWNILGMFPFNFALTSHLIYPFFLSFSFFVAINIIGFLQHKTKFVSLFLPSGTPFIIMPFLFLIEIISYLSRIFSLAIRLFANIMSGHILLKILMGALLGSFVISKIFIFINLIPLILLHTLVFMEICIAILQAYVFVVLCIIYLTDL